MALIESKAIEGLSIYGVQQKDYTVKGEANCDYLKAASIAMFQEANAIEAETAAYYGSLRININPLLMFGIIITYLLFDYSQGDDH